MAPVEAEKYFNDKPISRLDSTEPGNEQRILELLPTLIKVNCDVADDAGTITLINHTPDIRILASDGKYGHMLQEFPFNHLRFFGNQKVVVEKTIPDTDLKEVIVLWHHKGEAEQPPFRSERVPAEPQPPLNEDTVQLQPNSERELASAISR